MQPCAKRNEASAAGHRHAWEIVRVQKFNEYNSKWERANDYKGTAIRNERQSEKTERTRNEASSFNNELHYRLKCQTLTIAFVHIVMSQHSKL